MNEGGKDTGAEGREQEARAAAAAAAAPSKRVFTCHFCGAVLKRPMRCGSCRSVFYCSRTCQASDWPAHKAYCRAARERALLEESGLLLSTKDEGRESAPAQPQVLQQSSSQQQQSQQQQQQEPERTEGGEAVAAPASVLSTPARQMFASEAECAAAETEWLNAGAEDTVPVHAAKTPLEAHVERTALGSELLLLLRRCTLMAQLEALPFAVQDERRHCAMLGATMAAVRSAAAEAANAAAASGAVPSPVQVLVLVPACARLPLSVAACAAREGISVLVAAVDQHAELHRTTRATLQRNRGAPGADRIRSFLCEGFHGLASALGCNNSSTSNSTSSNISNISNTQHLSFCADVVVFDGFDGSFAGTGLFEALRSGELARCCGRGARAVPHAVRVMAVLGTLRRSVGAGSHAARALVDALWSPRMLVTDCARPVAVRPATAPFVAYQYNLQGALRRSTAAAAAASSTSAGTCDPSALSMRDYFAATRFVAARRCAPNADADITGGGHLYGNSNGSTYDEDEPPATSADVAAAWLELYANDDAEAAPFLSTREPTLSLGTMLQALAPRAVLGPGAVRLHVVVRATGSLAVSTRGGAATQAAAPELYTFPPTPPPGPLVWEHPALLDEGRLQAILHALDIVLKRRRNAAVVAAAASASSPISQKEQKQEKQEQQQEQQPPQEKEQQQQKQPPQQPQPRPQQEKPFVVTVGTPTACVGLQAAERGAGAVLVCEARGALCTACRGAVRGVRGVHCVRVAPLGLQPGRTAHCTRAADVLVHTLAAPGFFADGAVPFFAVAHEHRAVTAATAPLPATATLCAALLDTRIAVPGQRHDYAEGLLVRNHRACHVRPGSPSAAPHWAFLSRPVALFTFDFRHPAPLRAAMEAAVARFAGDVHGASGNAGAPGGGSASEGAAAGDEKGEETPLHTHIEVPVCRAGTLCAVAVWVECDVDGTRTVRLSSEPTEFYECNSPDADSKNSNKSDTTEPVHWSYHFDAMGQVVHWLPTQHAVDAGDVVALDADHDLRTLLVRADVARRAAGSRGGSAHALPLASLDPAPAFDVDLAGIRQSLVAVVAERLQDTRTAFDTAASTWRLLGVVTEYAEELGVDPAVAADFVANVCRTLYP